MSLYPYIQEQYSNFSPLLSPVKGFAFFVDIFDKMKPVSGEFHVGSEIVLLHEIIDRENAFTLAQKDKDRSRTALSGKLKEGEYLFTVKSSCGQTKTHKMFYKQTKLESPIITIRNENNLVFASWESKDASNYWVFAVPEGYYKSYLELFDKVKSLSRNRYTDKNFLISSNPFGENIKYRIIVRANTEVIVNGVPRFTKEAWGISSAVIE